MSAFVDEGRCFRAASAAALSENSWTPPSGPSTHQRVLFDIKGSNKKPRGEYKKKHFEKTLSVFVKAGGFPWEEHLFGPAMRGSLADRVTVRVSASEGWMHASYQWTGLRFVSFKREKKKNGVRRIWRGETASKRGGMHASCR